MIQQLSVFVENKQGALVETTGILTDCGINIRAMSLADTEKYGVLRMIVNNTAAAQKALGDAGFLTRITDVVAVTMPDKAGSLNRVVQLLAQAGVNLEYLYAFNNAGKNSAYVVLRVQDCALAEQTLSADGFPVLTAADLEKM